MLLLDLDDVAALIEFDRTKEEDTDRKGFGLEMLDFEI